MKLDKSLIKKRLGNIESNFKSLNKFFFHKLVNDATSMIVTAIKKKK